MTHCILDGTTDTCRNSRMVFKTANVLDSNSSYNMTRRFSGLKVWYQSKFMRAHSSPLVLTKFFQYFPLFLLYLAGLACPVCPPDLRLNSALRLENGSRTSNMTRSNLLLDSNPNSCVLTTKTDPFAMLSA